MRKKIMALKVTKSDSGGYEIFLDGKKLHPIDSYKIESSPIKGTAELSIKMLVEFPVMEENTSMDAVTDLTVFEAIKMVTDMDKLSELLFDVVRIAESPEHLSEMLKRKITYKELQTIKSIAQNGYPLSLDGIQ